MTIFVADFGAPKTGLKSDEIVQISRLINEFADSFFELTLSLFLQGSERAVLQASGDESVCSKVHSIYRSLV